MFDFSISEDPSLHAFQVLSVSGGGMLGVIPAAMLTRYEELGKVAYGTDYKLSDSFDLVGGTSTGAVIATAVALGCDAQTITDFYLRDAPQVMQRRWNAIPLVHDIYKGDLMEAYFSANTNGARLSPTDLNCDLAITVKDMGHARPVLFSSLKPGQSDILGAEIRHDALPLDRLMRASTAAPFLFSPVDLELSDGQTMTAVDGGMSPFNNPGLLLTRLATAATGRKVALTALGTGCGRPRYSREACHRGLSVLRGLRALMTNLKDAEFLTSEVLETMAETGTLSYQAHDLVLNAATFQALGVTVSRKDMAAIRRFGDPAGKDILFEAALTQAQYTISAPLPLVRSPALAAAV